jgi:hypothetical protein
VTAKKKQVGKAVKELAAIFDAHFAALPPAERKKRERDFKTYVASIGSHAKPATRAAQRASRDQSLHVE